MYEEIFKEINLTVVELPIEVVEDKPVYAGYLKEIPTITGVAHSRKELYQQLVQQYQAYAELMQSSEDEEQTSLLSVEQLMKYYDGEVFDGFSLKSDE